MCVSAKAMLSVPSVTMNAGSRTPVTRAPFSSPKADARERSRARSRRAAARRSPPRASSSRSGRSAITVPHGEVDARGQDHERLPDREHADDHHLLEHEREVLGLEEAVALEREEQPSSSSRAASGSPSAPWRSAARRQRSALGLGAVRDVGRAHLCRRSADPTAQGGMPRPGRGGQRPGRGCPSASTPSSSRGRRRRSSTRTPVTALPAIRLTPVSVYPRPSCRSSRSSRPRRRPWTPSAAGTAARSRR